MNHTAQCYGESIELVYFFRVERRLQEAAKGLALYQKKYYMDFIMCQLTMLAKHSMILLHT